MAKADVTMLAEKHNQADDYVHALKGKVSHPAQYNHYVIKVEHPKVLPQYNAVYVTYLQGHVYELVPPDAYKKEWKKWSFKTLPILPSHYRFQMSKKFAGGTTHRNAINDAIKNSKHLWLASDSDVEGENLGYIYLKMNGLLGKLDGRVWQNSQTDSGLKRAFNHIRNPLETVGNARAGYSRMIADWNIGMNYSRVVTLILNKEYHFPGVFSIGRVQTPLLALITQRRMQRLSFKPQVSYRLTFTDSNNLKFLGDKKACSFKDKDKANGVAKKLQNQPLVVQDSKKKHHSVGAPKLPKTGDVQGFLVKHDGITAAKALNKVLEPMYDTEHIISYPRTDCNMMVVDDFNRLKKDFPKYKALLEHILHKKLPDSLFGNMKPRSRYVDKTGKKVQAVGHSALIPEEPIDYSRFKKLNHNEQTAYKFILFHTMSMFANNFGYNQLIVKGKVNKMLFTAKEKANIASQVGWHHIMGSTGSSHDIKAKYTKGQSLNGQYHLKHEQTSPPTAITEANLIAKVMPHFQFGTQATRAGIIQRLSDKKLVTKAKRKDPKRTLVRSEFEPTDKGIVELELMHKSKLLNIAKVSSWSKNMRKIAKGEFLFKDFIHDIDDTIRNEVAKLPKAHYNFTIKPPKQKPKAKNIKKDDTGITCPKCKKGHITLLSMDDPDDKGNYHHIAFYVCSRKSCKFYASTHFEDLKITPDVLKQIINGDFKQRAFKYSGGTFKARLVCRKGKIAPVFPSPKPQKMFDITCPKCHKGKIGLLTFKSKKKHKTYKIYVCSRDCGFSVFSTMAGVKITPDLLKTIIQGKMKPKQLKSRKGKPYIAKFIYQNGKIEMQFVDKKKK